VQADHRARFRWSTIALVIGLAAVAAFAVSCSGDDGDESGGAPVATATPDPAAASDGEEAATDAPASDPSVCNSAEAGGNAPSRAEPPAA
jgi:hypothetical protein